jgi:hypothetical protein
VDAVVLAQASMAPAAALLADQPVPVLASPRLGLEAAVAAWRGAALYRTASSRLTYEATHAPPML